MTFRPPRQGAWLVALVATACDAEPLVERDVGDAEACADLAAWPEDATAAEDALVGRLVALRERDLPCAEQTPLAPLAAVPALRCAARRHALDLAERKTLAAEGSDGTTPQARAAEAGYVGRLRYELRAADFRAASEVSDALLADEDHCAALA
ncbi:MAG: CAP domain-containing protein, partial [Deltaproteobacteria bacterium]